MKIFQCKESLKFQCIKQMMFHILMKKIKLVKILEKIIASIKKQT